MMLLRGEKCSKGGGSDGPTGGSSLALAVGTERRKRGEESGGGCENFP